MKPHAKIPVKIFIILIICIFTAPFVSRLINDFVIKNFDKSYTSYDLEKISLDILKRINNLDKYDEEKIKDFFADEKKRDNNLEFVFFGDSGKPVYSTLGHKERTEDFKKIIEEKERILKKESSKNFKLVDYFDWHDYFLVMPIIINNEQKGNFLITVKKEYVLPFYISINRDKIFLCHFLFLLSFAVTVIISFILFLFFSMPMVKRIRTFYNRVKNYEPEKPDIKINDSVNDEIGLISGTFDMMIDRINRYYEDQRKFYHERQELFRNVSHDFRTPLTSILGYATSLDEKIYENEKEAETFVKIIRKKAEYMTDLFNEMMEIYKLNSDIVIIKKESFDISEMIREIIIEYIPQFEKESFYYEIDIQNTVIVNGDKDRLSRAVRNIIDNVFKHGSAGKFFGITVRGNNGGAEIIIKDKGEGIPMENIFKIFERFYKGTKKTGMGLGLSIAKDIIEKHNGTLIAESVLGSGSSFYIELPA